MLNHILKLLAITITIAFSNHAQAILASSGSVYLSSISTDFYGDIETKKVTLTHGVDGIFSIEGNFDQGASVTFQDNNYWSFDFSAPTYDPITNTNNGNPLEVGFYNHATDYSFNSPIWPILNFSSFEWDNFFTDPDAWFDVRAIEYGIDNEVLSLAIDFLQFDKSLAVHEASTFGSLRINSDVELNFTGDKISQVPLPAALWLFGSGLMMLIGVSKRRI
jgi:hypothetical protein